MHWLSSLLCITLHQSFSILSPQNVLNFNAWTLPLEKHSTVSGGNLYDSISICWKLSLQVNYFSFFKLWLLTLPVENIVVTSLILHNWIFVVLWYLSQHLYFIQFNLIWFMSHSKSRDLNYIYLICPSFFSWN